MTILRPKPLFAGALLAGVLGVGPAWAQSVDEPDEERAPSEDESESPAAVVDRDAARRAYERARELDAEGRTREALPHAWDAYRLFPTGASRYAVGLIYERLGEVDSAARQYRMALGEADPPSESIRAQIEEALARLSAPSDPLPPEPPPAELTAMVAEPPPQEPPVEPPPDPPRDPPPLVEAPPATLGLRFSAVALADARRPTSALGAEARADYRLLPAVSVGLGVGAPALSFALRAHFSPLEGPIRPRAGLFAGWSPIRGEDTQSGGVFAGPTLGASAQPLSTVPLWLVVELGFALDLGRLEDGLAFTLPVGLGVALDI
jgi:hypothetical protein